LARTAPRERRAILAECTEVPLTFGEVIHEPNARLKHVYFPVHGFVSLVTPAGPAHSLEVALVGTEGLCGATVILGMPTPPLRGLVQGAGSALRMGVREFRAAYAEHPGLKQVVDAYLYVQLAQIAQIAACGRFHDLNARLARWLLMTQDRAASDTFKLTHTFLAQMLGVRRAGVTTAAGDLQRRKFIHYRRGMVQVLNRSGLESVACGCYAALNSIYDEALEASRKH
jgi:hypothetical protein